MVDRHIYGNYFAVHKSLVPHIKKFRPVLGKIAVLRINSRPIDVTLVYVHVLMDTNEDNVSDPASRM